jgi:alkanesulfonate monooxygenase SsuD/methylene tetrahydromethanopterin reductase-like flavin-dependent oxidoreductase (luciferase family)
MRNDGTSPRNNFKIGIFAANCSGGNAATRVPERWEPTWDNNLAIARMADEAGLEFMLPLGRWAGYGGTTDHNGTSFETLTWAAGLLAQTRRIMAFSTVHVTLTNPVAAAKQMATIDHLGQGRFGLNIVCGWNRDEFEMLGARLDGHTERYALGQEWIDIVNRIWCEDAPFDFHGRHFQLKHVYGRPKPVQQPRPVIMNAGASADGLDFAVRNADYLFTSFTTPEDALARTSKLKADAGQRGRKVGIFTTAHVVCRPTRREAEEYVQYYSVDNADDGAVEAMFVGRGWRDHPHLSDEVKRQMWRRLAAANGGHLIVGDPDDVAAQMQGLAASGLDGIAMGLVNYTQHFPYFRDEVLPRLTHLGLRA